MRPAFPSLISFFILTGAKWNGLIPQKICLVFVYVLYKFVSGLVVGFFGNLWFDDLYGEWSETD